jgi:hypothetical protein
VFDSANPDSYLAHYDTEHDPARTAALPSGPTGMHAWLDLLMRLSRAPVVSIVSIWDAPVAPEASSRWPAACASYHARTRCWPSSRWEPVWSPGAVRLPRLVGRGRALEILLVADDLDGPRAEQYGYVNRAMADEQLDAQVEEMASRLARFDHDAITRTKSYVDQVTLPADNEFPPASWSRTEMLDLPGRAEVRRAPARGCREDERRDLAVAVARICRTSSPFCSAVSAEAVGTRTRSSSKLAVLVSGDPEVLQALKKTQ